MSGANTKYKNDVQGFIDEYGIDSLLLLPSTHSTQCHNVENVLRQKAIKLTYCKVLEDNLAYFFYGKASFKASPYSGEAVSNYMFSPVCFIVDTAKLKAKRIFPFDSGAFKGNRYESYFPPNAKIEEFELISDVNLIPKFIKLFYGDNEAYIKGECLHLEDAEAYNATFFLNEFLRASGRLPFDERSRTVEIVVGEDVILSNSVRAIIMPAPFQRNREFQKFHTNNPNIEIISYDVHYPRDPYLANDTIFKEVIKYIQK